MVKPYLIGLFVVCSIPSLVHGFQKNGPPPKEKKALEMQVQEVKRAGRWLVGKVTDSAGQALEGVLVEAKGTKGPPYTSVVRRGQFYIMAPPGDTYTLTITMTGYKTVTMEIK